MRDLHEDLVRFYEFQLGKLPHRDAFKRALQATFAADDLRVFFLLPFFGVTPIEKVEKKAARLGISADELGRTVQRLMPEGLVDTYVGPAGRVCGRAPLIALLEFQVRLQEESPLRAVCTQIMNDLIEGAAETIPTKTPYFRVLPVERTLRHAGADVGIRVDQVVPDPRQVLPIDIVSEMVKKEPIIAVADCYCRSTKNLLEESCGHPLETCFYFNELALVKLESGYARQIGYDEALDILRQCEQQGLVHNVSNCEGRIQTLCNCCACSCAVMKAIVRGQSNVGAASRFVVAIDGDGMARCESCLTQPCLKVCNLHNLTSRDRRVVINVEACIGCGQCAAHCPEGVLRMVVRQRPPRIFRDNDALFRRINAEAMLGLALRKVLGR